MNCMAILHVWLAIGQAAFLYTIRLSALDSELSMDFLAMLPQLIQLYMQLRAAMQIEEARI